MADQWTNMAQIGTCHPAHHHYPSNTEEVRQAILYVRSHKGKCRVAGAGKSPNTSTFTSDHLLHMTRMHRILSIDTTARTVTCEPGVLMEDLMNELDKAGLMLRCVPSYVQTTIAGCLATATHSSGITSNALPDYVQALKIVDGKAEVRVLSVDKDEAELRLAACHLGVLGVVTEVTLAVHPRVQWRLESKPLTMQDATNVALVAEKVKTYEYYRWWWVPHTEGCYESYGSVEDIHEPAGGAPHTRVTPKGAVTEIPPPPPATGKRDSLSDQHADPMKPNPAVRPAERLKTGSNAAPCKKPDFVSLLKSALSLLVGRRAVEWSLWLACYYPSLQPLINQTYVELFYSTPQVLCGSALKCFTFDCLFRQWANEWAIDASRAVEAFHKLRAMIDKEGMLLHFPVEFRFTGADKTAMSPGVDRATCWIGVVMYRPHGQEARDTQRCYQGFCKLMEEMGGRPHWAKYYDWGHRQVSAAYGAHWDRFLDLRRQMDPDGLFVNKWFGNLMSPDRVNSTTYVE